MNELHFAQPQWIHLLWAVALFVVLLAWLERRGGDALDRLVSAALRPRLLTGPSGAQRAARIACLGLAGVFLTLALMRPQWGLTLVESERAGAEIMVALDVSRSMLAEDVAPNRLDRAKAEIRDLLTLLDGDQVGLVAFAGRASVLSPLTPDFGFLRLALDDAGPASVSRGGTRLEEPIRKAVAGFGELGDVSRSILLITDGEDHDSFPLEAAKDAAERGIRILAIGFGDEAGAPIPLTDPTTGARTMLRDADGIVVTSRLDGDLLRDMALATGGAYVPAGTGQLDLESIYRRHIAPLTRGRLDGRTRAVRNDIFQWAVLLALVSLVGAAVSTAASRERGSGSALAVTLVATLVAGMPHTAPAQADGSGAPGPEVDAADAADTVEAPSLPEIPADPRTAYNEGIAALDAGDAEAAARLLEAARQQAGTDAETRFRATYNLGWAEVRAADALLEPAPEESLERLYRAASWFREAVDLRPSAEDARYNLELVMRRALELADSLAERDEGDILSGIEELIEAQRGFLGLVRQGVEAAQQAPDTGASPELRRLFRSLAARGLTVLGDAEALTGRAAREVDAIAAKPDEERTPEEALRAAQVEQAIGHLHAARERIAQARSRLRRLQAERAYRRAAAGLDDFRRARDQLIDPVRRLDALLADGVEVARLTGVRAALDQGVAGLEGAGTAPGWLTPRYLEETQMVLEVRAGELYRGLAAGLEQPVEGEPPPDQARLLAALREATPLIETARGGFERAASALAGARYPQAVSEQRVALEALAGARERLLELRPLIELVYGDEQRVAALLGEDASGEQPIAQRAALGGSLHGRNVERAVRLGEMLTQAMLDASQASGDEAAPGPATSGDGGRYEQGYELLRQALHAMHRATDPLAALADGAGEPDGSTLADARAAVSEAVTHIESLRRLFFSVLEHLRETAERQRVLADDTETAQALSDPADQGALARQAGPLGERQRTLAGTADAIAGALRQQGEAPPSADGTGAGPDPERLLQAAELVASAGGAMRDSAAGLGGEPPAMDEARTGQDAALASLAEAIALLQQGDPQQQDQDQQSQQQQQQQQQAADGDQQPQSQPADADRLLQGVRDREAQRREEQARGRRQGYEPVEKDW